MDYLKCFLYFLLGFILHLLLKGKIVEGFQNELLLYTQNSENNLYYDKTSMSPNMGSSDILSLLETS